MNAFVDVRDLRSCPARARAVVPVVLAREVVRERAFKPGEHLLRQGDDPRWARVLLEGCTYHYRILPNGTRQITAIQVPGDICNLAAVMRGGAGYSVVALPGCVVGEIPIPSVAEPGLPGADIARLLWRHLLREDAVAREWLVSLGRRDALARVAHLFSELRVRLEDVGLARDGTAFPFFLTQIELADAVGLSAVHINRVLQSLRRSGVIEWRRGILTIRDVDALEASAGFDRAYLRWA